MKKISYATVVKIVLSTLSNNAGTLKEIDCVVGLVSKGLFPAALIATELKKQFCVYDLSFDSKEIKGKNVLLVTDFFFDDATALEVKNSFLRSGANGVELFSIFHKQGVMANPIYSKKVGKEVSFPWS